MALHIPLTHMADIAYLLLIFIIIFSLLSTQTDAAVSLPASTHAGEKADTGTTLTITNDHYSIGQSKTDDTSSLRMELERAGRETPVAIIAGGDIPFGRIREALRLLEELGFTTIEFMVIRQ